MYNHSLEERQYIEPGNTPIKKRTSSQSQVRNIKEIKVGRCQVKFINDSYHPKWEQKQLPLICNKIYSNSSECLHSWGGCYFVTVIIKSFFYRSLFVLITLKLRGEACCQTDQSIFVLVTVETIWLVHPIGVNKVIWIYWIRGKCIAISWSLPSNRESLRHLLLQV